MAAALAGTLVLIAHGGIDNVAPGAALHAPPRGSGDLDIVAVLLAVCSTAPLLAWRRFPLAVFVATAMASAALAGFGYRVGITLGPAAALYLLAASRDQRSPWTRQTTVTVFVLFGTFVAAITGDRGSLPGIGVLLHAGLPWAVAWFAGERTRLRHEHIADLKERARRAEREAERERLLAVAQERARIARDLHDSAGHAINVIAVQAGAARLSHDHDPQRSLSALQAIEDLARQTADEIDQLVGTLREQRDRDFVEIPVGLGSLEGLIAEHQAAGLDISLVTTGTSGPITGVADQAAYRIIQEALTNAARHGRGSAHVEVSFHDDAIDVTITNPATLNGSAREGGGHGLIGMRERATLLGGSLAVERTDGTFRVQARIPHRGHRS